MNKSNKIYNSFSKRIGQIAVLVDPEKCNTVEAIKKIVDKAEFARVDYIFVGGSTVSSKDFNTAVDCLKKISTIPVIIFPGAPHQISKNADALLYLSLLSGRNPDYLIGHHVSSASEIYDLGIEIIPTSYILIDGGSHSSVAYVSQTTPIPADQTGIILSTVKAGILQGKQIVYFDAGSGAPIHVPFEVIKQSSLLGVPIIVGGGIDSIEKIETMRQSGANVIVIGNKIEENIDFLLEIHSYLARDYVH